MTASEVNIMVDVRQALDRRSGDALLGALRRTPGVSRARVSPRVPRMVLVDYNPTLTDTRHILGAVVDRGFDARLIDM